MRACRHRWPRTLGALACALAAAWPARGADNSGAATPPPEKSAPARADDSPNAIGATKRELDTIKALRDPAQKPKGALPSMSMPELHSLPGALPSANSASKSSATNPTAKSATWLVDAMEKGERDKSRGSRGDASRRGSRERETDDDSGRPGERATLGENARRDEKDEADVRANRSEAEARDSRAAANPLTRYLGEWMTPRDYAALKPSLDAAAAPGGAGALDSSGALPLVPGVTTPAIPGIEAALGPNAAATALPPAPRENPYLAAMQPAPIAALPVPPPGIAIPAPAPAPVVAAPAITPAAPAPRPKVPDFAKPASDEKYFKQLKRF